MVSCENAVLKMAGLNLEKGRGWLGKNILEFPGKEDLGGNGIPYECDKRLTT